MPRLPHILRVYLAAFVILAPLALLLPVHAAPGSGDQVAKATAASTGVDFANTGGPGVGSPYRATFSTPAPDPPALVLAIDDGLPAGLSAVPSTIITYTLVFTNVGDSAAINVQLAAVVPNYTHWVSDTAELWTCSAATDAIASPLCRTGIASLAPHTAHQVNLAVRVDDPVPGDVTTIRFDASVNADNVICGECGQGSVLTPVDPDQHVSGDYRLFIPHCVRG